MAELREFALLLILGMTACGSVYGVHDMSRLGSYIKSQSDPDTLPPSSGPLDIHFQFHLLNVADVDRERNVVEMEGMSVMRWNSSITWDPSDYGGIQAISLPAKYFWVPRFQDTRTAQPYEDFSPHIVSVHSNGLTGTAMLLRPRLLCDVTDIATGSHCTVLHTLWGYTKAQINPVPYPPVPPAIAARRYFSGSRYEIIGGSENISDYQMDGTTFQMVNTTLVVREKPRAQNHGPFKALFQWGH